MSSEIESICCTILRYSEWKLFDKDILKVYNINIANPTNYDHPNRSSCVNIAKYNRWCERNNSFVIMNNMGEACHHEHATNLKAPSYKNQTFRCFFFSSELTYLMMQWGYKTQRDGRERHLTTLASKSGLLKVETNRSESNENFTFEANG